MKRSFRLAAPYEITANVENSDTLGRLRGAVLQKIDDMKQWVASKGIKKQCREGGLDFVPAKNIEFTQPGRRS